MVKDNSVQLLFSNIKIGIYKLPIVMRFIFHSFFHYTKSMPYEHPSVCAESGFQSITRSSK